MPYLGIRESRRIVGKKTLMKDILSSLPVPEDTVAMAGYNVDIHGQTSGVMTMLPVAHAIGIPLGCLIPEKMENLIMSGRTISVDQTIFGMTCHVDMYGSVGSGRCYCIPCIQTWHKDIRSGCKRGKGSTRKKRCRHQLTAFRVNNGKEEHHRGDKGR